MPTIHEKEGHETLSKGIPVIGDVVDFKNKKKFIHCKKHMRCLFLTNIKTYQKLKDKHKDVFGVYNVMKCYNVGMLQLL